VNLTTWSDVGHHPDCQFVSFIHASPQQEPTRGPNHQHAKEMQEAAQSRLNPLDDFFPEACTKRCHGHSIFKPGLVTNKRREGGEHTRRGPAVVYQLRINIIVVPSNHHHTRQSPSKHSCRQNLLSSTLKTTDTTSPPPRLIVYKWLLKLIHSTRSSRRPQ
jgi:hypothetical protein